MRTSDRCSYLGGSDARTILGKDENALLRLWQEKRGEIEPEDLSGNLLVQFGCATEELNRRWFERETGHSIGAVQRFVRHPKLEWMGATLDGIVPDDGAVFEAKFMLPWNFAEDVAADKHMAQLQHNMLVTGARRAYLSILTGYCRFAFSRTPGPPPFSGMNSMPAASRARSIAWITRRCSLVASCFRSAPPMVGMPDDSRAPAPAQPKQDSARAMRSCAPVIDSSHLSGTSIVS